MREQDKESVLALVASVYAFYRVDCSPFALSIWWEAMQPYDFMAVKDGFNRHCVNPDNGQFLPKPADIVKLIGGGTQDAALIAWAKVEAACRSVGQYQSVVFDDPIIHCVIRDMGDWVKLCNTDVDELPFRAKEFEQRYRGYKLRGSVGEFPRTLIGIAEGSNKAQGLPADLPVMIGEQQKCLQVYKGGSLTANVPMRQANALIEMDHV